jgi:anti-sigma B factor antagonist
LSDVLATHRAPGATIILDLSGLSFMDSTGMRLLLEADAESRANGHSLELRAPTKAVTRVLEIAGVLDRLPFTVTDPA